MPFYLEFQSYMSQLNIIIMVASKYGSLGGVWLTRHSLQMKMHLWSHTLLLSIIEEFLHCVTTVISSYEFPV